MGRGDGVAAGRALGGKTVVENSNCPEQLVEQAAFLAQTHDNRSGGSMSSLRIGRAARVLAGLQLLLRLLPMAGYFPGFRNHSMNL